MRTDRRTFLRTASSGFGGLAMAGLLAEEALGDTANARATRPRSLAVRARRKWRVPAIGDGVRGVATLGEQGKDPLEHPGAREHSGQAEYRRPGGAADRDGVEME